MKLLLDEMHSTALATTQREQGNDAAAVAELGLTGSSHDELFAASVSDGYAILTENVADFARISADHVAAGRPHHGVMIAAIDTVVAPAGGHELAGGRSRGRRHQGRAYRVPAQNTWLDDEHDRPGPG